MTERIVLTGGSGFVAGSVIAQSGEREVHVLSRGKSLLQRAGIHWHNLDVTDPVALAAKIHEIGPSAILHTAAIADIDYCQAHQTEAEAVNATWTANLAALAEAHGAKLVFLSTDNVFDGVRGRYSESDAPSPSNYYGETKVIGENAVARIPDATWVVARVSLVMGLPMLGVGNSFLSRMLPSLEAGEVLGVPPMEIRSPIDVVTLGRALLELAGNDFCGYLNLSGDDILNRCEMVQRIAMHLGYPAHQVIPKDPTHIPGRAPRPRDASLLNTRAHEVLDTKLCGLEEGLERVLANRPS
jgi:dTDP-4-dehydrorhamnose reductase